MVDRQAFRQARAAEKYDAVLAHAHEIARDTGQRIVVYRSFASGDGEYPFVEYATTPYPSYASRDSDVREQDVRAIVDPSGEVEEFD